MRDEVVPPSVHLLDSMRSVGYSLSAALADLIDNSISAGASHIEIDADTVDASYVAILDDGCGMGLNEAREALRLAGTARQERGETDLGRFGLGLKTASLSQARSVTVCSFDEGHLHGLRWDLDHVETTREWSLQILGEDEARQTPLADELERRGQGTLVVWDKLDLLLGDTADAGGVIRESLAIAMDHLALTFHRFLTTPNAITIEVNGTVLSPRDPFLERNTRTQTSPTERVFVDGQPVYVTAYTLPHASGLTATERRRPDLTGAMRESQGFYVYRNRRLISHGDWFGLASRTELSKQTRVRVDVPVTLDHLWRLDIKKQRTDPPASFRHQLRRIIEPVIEKGRRVHTFRGRKSTNDELVHVWNRYQSRGGQVSYEVNSGHPLYQALRSALTPVEGALLDSLMTLVSEQFPSQDLYNHMADNRTAQPTSASEETIAAQLRALASSGYLNGSIGDSLDMLRNVEPFASVPNIEALVRAAVEETDHAAQ